jgi:hypothetical protein
MFDIATDIFRAVIECELSYAAQEAAAELREKRGP